MASSIHGDDEESSAGHPSTRTACQQCGKAAAHQFTALTVEKTIRLKKEGESFVWNSYRFRCIVRPLRSGASDIRLEREDGKVLSPDHVAVYGDLYAYWLPDSGKDVSFCSRQCAVSYARATNSILANKSSSAIIDPQQDEFDQYGSDHQLEATKALAQQDDWKSREDELRGLLIGRPFRPDRILALAALLASQDREALAEEAVETVLSQYGLGEVISAASSILHQLGKDTRVEELWQQLAMQHGGIEKLPAEALSTWALVARSSEQKKQLSDLAVHKRPRDVKVFENHLLALGDCFAEDAYLHLSRNRDLLTTDIGYFNAGMICLQLGKAANAEEYLRVSDTLLEEPLTKAYLSEALYQQGKHAEALSEARQGRRELERFLEEGLPDADGAKRLPRGYVYEHKRGLQKLLLCVEGKCLISIGETAAGERRIRDAMDIGTVLSESPVVLDAARFLEGYKDRPALETELADAHRRALELTATATRYQISSDRLAEVLKAIAGTQRQWAQFIESAIDVATQDLVAEQFFSHMHALVTVFRNGKRHIYESLFASFQKRYPHLPPAIIEPMANSDFLVAELTTDDLPVYAGAIIESCKALECGVNLVLVESFCKTQNLKNGLKVTVRPLYGNKKWDDLELVRVGKSIPDKGLMFGNLEALLRSDDARWLQFVSTLGNDHQKWVIERLPKIIDKTAKIRNGCAHSSSAGKSKAVELSESFSAEQVFENLNAIQQAMTCSNSV